ncbi:MAG: hypothetical protein ABSE96_11610 [Terracidiphilus sp.]
MRPDLLECRCGAELKATSRERIDEASGDLLDLVRRKVLGLAIPNSYPSKIPANDLGRMKLWNLLYLIEILGRRSRSGLLSRRESATILLRASTALSDWPNNFFCLLEGFEQPDWDKAGVPLTKGSLKGFYFALMFGLKPRRESLFVRQALSQFASSRHGVGSIDPALREPDSSEGSLFLPKSRLAQRLGIDRRMLDRLIDGNKVEVLRTRRGKREHVWIETSNADLAKLEGKVYGAPEAARLVAIPQSVLKELKKSGLYRVARLTAGSRGYHERDIQEFIRTMKSHAQPAKNRQEEMLPFRQAVRYTYFTVAMKVEFVGKILEGKIPLFGKATTPLDQCLVPRSLILSFAREATARSIAEESTETARDGLKYPMTTEEAARTLGCFAQAIPRLVAAGHLKGLRRRKALWVDRASVYRFNEKYVRMASVARGVGSQSGALINICLKYHIPMIVCEVPGKCKQHVFISRRHETKLREQYIQARKVHKE